MDYNTLILGSIFFADLSILVFLSRYGAKAVGFSVVMNMLLVSVLAQKEIVIFGLHNNLGVIPYAVATTSISLCAVKHGLTGCVKLINATFACLLLFLVVVGLSTLLPSMQGNESITGALKLLFSPAPQIAFASFIAFYSSQTVNCVIIERLHLPLYVRKIFANTVAQGIDSILFYQIAMVGLIPQEKIFLFIVGGVISKSILNIIDIPFFVLALRWHKEEKFSL